MADKSSNALQPKSSKKKKKTEIDAADINVFDKISEIEAEKKDGEKEIQGKVLEEKDKGLLITPARLILLSVSLYLFFMSIIGTGVYYYVSNIKHIEKKTAVRHVEPSQIIKPEDIPSPLEVGTFFIPLKKGEGIASQGEESFLKLSVSVWGKGDGLNNEVQDKIILIRENIYGFLNKKGVESFKSVDAKNILNKELFDIINRSLKDNRIEKLFFTEFFIM